MSNTIDITTIPAKGNKKESQSGKMYDVTFVYTKLQEGEDKRNAADGRDYVTNIVVSEDQADDFKEAFPSNGVKKIKTSEFEEKYKCAPPYPEERSQYIVKVIQNTALSRDVGDLKKGDKIPYTWPSRPKAYLQIDGGVKDITMTDAIGNGSKGDIAFNIFSNKEFNTYYPRLTAILVKDLVEYSLDGGDGGSGGSVFGNVVGGLNEGDGTIQQKATMDEQESENPAPREVPKSSPATDESVQDDFDSDIPF